MMPTTKPEARNCVYAADPDHHDWSLTDVLFLLFGILVALFWASGLPRLARFLIDVGSKGSRAWLRH